MKTAWTDDLSVGNGMIDADHLILFGLINGVEHAIESGDCAAVKQALELLDGRLRTHFQNEEGIANAIKYPFAQHKQAQQYLLEELGYLRNELIGKAGLWCGAAVEHYSDLLRGLLIDHITSKDMLMKPVLQGYPYGLTAAKQEQGFAQNASGYGEERHAR
ncbi:MAG: hypothetical protein OEV23_00570 [Gallionella sp.]|nr:hypothetical protein [Gallionella sp.]